MAKKAEMDYAEFRTPKSFTFCINAASKCRKLTEERMAIQRKLLNRHGKLRK